MGERVALLGLRGRADSMVAPSGIRPTAVGQEGRPGHSLAAPSTTWVDSVGNAKGTAGHWPLSLRGHRLVSIERDLGWSVKRLRVWRFPPELGCKVDQDSATPGSPRTPVACLGGRLGNAGERWLPGWRQGPAPAKMSLKSHPLAPAAFYGHTTLNAPHLV